MHVNLAVNMYAQRTESAMVRALQLRRHCTEDKNLVLVKFNYTRSWCSARNASSTQAAAAIWRWRQVWRHGAARFNRLAGTHMPPW